MDQRIRGALDDLRRTAIDTAVESYWSGFCFGVVVGSVAGAVAVLAIFA